MFVVYEVCSGWSSEDMRFASAGEACSVSVSLSEHYGTEFRVRQEF
jgi:hypothetical protein